jgi:glycosyl transferase family 9 (putative heptosyltransferase)
MARRASPLGCGCLMGQGDQLLATGLARGAKARGKRIAFGDGRNIIWDKHSAAIFRGNPNIARPGSERDPDIEWVPFYKGHRIYNSLAADRWIWNHKFHAIPGEMFFDDQEIEAGKRFGLDFVVVEPQSAQWKAVAVNKDWGVGRFQEVAERLKAAGRRVVQFRGDLSAVALAGVEQMETRSFRDALAVMANASLYIGGEGGLHHGAAAVNIPAVVIFGGFIPPSVTGYAAHINLTGGAEACGSLKPCAHCRRAMTAISINDVYGAAMNKLLPFPLAGAA